MMTSGGGLTTLATAAKFPIRLVESGPAGGAILAAVKSRKIGSDRVLSFDMGGTTAKICLIDDMQPLLSRAFEVDRRYRFKKGSGLPVRIPVIEMVEIGAGGGSIGSIDSVGRVQVGPESAGSQPGPACYGLGGNLPTVTDADVALGRLDGSRFAGGQMTLDPNNARRAISDRFSDYFTDTGAAAVAMSEVVDETMSQAARGHAAEWGKSIDTRTMVAYGGAAPLHAARLMQKLHLDRVVIPKDAGVGSALGFLLAPISYEVVKSVYMRLSQFNQSRIQEILDELRIEAMDVVEQATAEPVEVSVTVLMRYVGQGYEISVPVEVASIDIDYLRKEFDSHYRQLYQRLIPDGDIEIMSWTLRASTHPPLVEPIVDSTPDKIEKRSNQEIQMTFNGETLSTLVLPREDLELNSEVEGPILVVERHTTTVVPKDFSVTVNAEGDLVLRMSAQ